MSSCLSIRAARKEDIAALSDILIATFEQVWQPQLTGPGIEKSKDFPARVHDYLEQYVADIYVATMDDRPLGMIHWIGDFVAALHVSPMVQGKGVGGILLAFAEQEIVKSHEQVRLETDSFNAQSRAFYQKHGFEEIKQYPDEEWDSGFTTILLQKTLK
ncbi:GNAT family N-acetyltransferase [Maritalea mediterranea]|uniref:GNAT family N-acetyltransferase n=1 Tax=Maritalea mediterranea TaxID=2909667 RepID=A0ABS9E5G9_9HYPH|nr:GNAT family N-acetyltransferase [Maritalea mediterranea]MCF4097035.1 GNAT family N-acetyltransferase [Maritalea mediterranea]